jgi:hypothetical protein
MLYQYTWLPGFPTTELSKSATHSTRFGCMRLVLVQTPPLTQSSHNALRDCRVLGTKPDVSARAAFCFSCYLATQEWLLSFVWSGSRAWRSSERPLLKRTLFLLFHGQTMQSACIGSRLLETTLHPATVHLQLPLPVDKHSIVNTQVRDFECRHFILF